MSKNAATDDFGNAVIEASPEPIGPAPDQVEEIPSEEPVPRSRKESCQWDASEVDEWIDDAWNMETIYNPSFNLILRSLRSIDLIRDRDFLEQTREYLMARRDIAKSHLDDAGRLQDLKRYVRFQAKVSVIDILLSNDTLETRQRIRAKRRVKSSS
jgi:hypothetical protein